MASVFTRIIEGELPARFVWRDEQCVAFLTHPIRSGHTLVVPRKEVDHWLDLEPELAAHLMFVAQSIGKALKQGFEASRVVFLIAGTEVPHAHIHLIPIEEEVYRIHPALLSEEEFHALDIPDLATPDPDPAELDRAAETIRLALQRLDFQHVAH
jgi:histidine triad (HIT) family protein